MRRLVLLFVPLFMFVGVASLAALPATPVFAVDNILQDACSGSNTSESPTCDTSSTEENPLTGSNGIILRIAQFIALLAGFAAIIVIIISGMRYITAGGDTQKAVGARNSLIGAIVGLVIVALAEFIITAVIKGFL